MHECRDCHQPKPHEDFPRNKTYSSGHTNQCKACRSTYARAFYEANADAYREAARNRYAADPERFKAAVLAHYYAYADEINAKQRAYYLANRDRFAVLQTAWAIANPERVRAIKRRYKARRGGWEVQGMTAEDRTVSACYRMAIANDACAYCGGRAESMHDDHVQPLSREGTDHWWNLARACAPCNISKGSKTIHEFRAYTAKKAGV